jgi:hypothetical protein
MRAFVRIATEVLCDRVPARAGANGTLASRPIAARH